MFLSKETTDEFQYENLSQALETSSFLSFTLRAFKIF